MVARLKLQIESQEIWILIPCCDTLNDTRHVIFIFQMPLAPLSHPSYNSQIIHTFKRLTIMTLLKYKSQKIYSTPLAP